jgi:hypothetical protein
MMPSSLLKVHRKLCWSCLYGGFEAADAPSFAPATALFSSMKTSEMKLLTTDGLTAA